MTSPLSMLVIDHMFSCGYQSVVISIMTEVSFSPHGIYVGMLVGTDDGFVEMVGAEEMDGILLGVKVYPKQKSG